MIQQIIANNKTDIFPCTSTKYNITQANLGRAFFRQLIHDSDSFNDINESTICSLMHFFIQEAAYNGRSVQFSSGLCNTHTHRLKVEALSSHRLCLGMFVVYDSTERLFAQLMMAKSAQDHSNEHRSGFVRRLCHFALDLIRFISRILLRRKSSIQSPFIYLRGDESSHFRERGNRHDRWNVYPA